MLLLKACILWLITMDKRYTLHETCERVHVNKFLINGKYIFVCLIFVVAHHQKIFLGCAIMRIIAIACDY